MVVYRREGVGMLTTEQVKQLPEVYWDGLPSRLPAVMGEIAFDTETNGLYADDGARVSVVSVAWLEGEGQDAAIRYAAWPFAQGKVGKPEDDGVRDLFGAEDDHNLPEVEWMALCNWLALEGCGVGGHNVKFDIEKIRAGTLARPGVGVEGWPGPDLTDRVTFDTQVAQREINPTWTTALKPVAAALWGEDQDAEAKALKAYLGPKTNPRYDLVPWDVMKPYAARDAAMTLRLRLHQLALEEEGFTIHGGPYSGSYWVRREVAVMQVLARMEARGLPYDSEESCRAAAEVVHRQREIEQKLPFEVGQAKEFYFGRTPEGQGVRVAAGPAQKGETVKGMGLTPYEVTEKKRDPKMTAEIVAQMVEEEIEWAKELQSHTKLATANKMWYLPYANGVGLDQRLRTCFRQVASGAGDVGGTASGRFSVERVNLQAIPHDYRLSDFEDLQGIPTPRQIIGQAAAKLEGWGLWELDLAQAELRVAAMWAECGRMLELIADGADLHGDTTTALFGLTKEADRFKVMRQVAKRGNFSLIFGSGWLTFQRMVKKETGIKLSDRDAQRIVADWNALYPQYRKAIDRHSRHVDRNRWVPLANGRRRHFKWMEDTHKAFNQRVQASLAELGKDWMLRSDALLRQMKLDQRGIEDGVGRGGLLLTIHDSQVLLLPLDEGEQIAQEVRQLGRGVWAEMFPGVPGDVDVKRWGSV